eukprot:CAMPEP_0168373534 /NCGR_PEP_ID=MMETSP0228-20121227/8837_1 /TAXON_ID=133427 /ORGANISM="Protoceratium reticulatum, Strain CCCM 535 (=CCMP 1889)" /LENGTH=381 /DNA_ID=CAMNT_0008386457 /DNA_START=76 /DNA_END=1221 /DNA_ORIENTATION=+
MAGGAAIVGTRSEPPAGRHPLAPLLLALCLRACVALDAGGRHPREGGPGLLLLSTARSAQEGHMDSAQVPSTDVLSKYVNPGRLARHQDYEQAPSIATLSVYKNNPESAARRADLTPFTDVRIARQISERSRMDRELGPPITLRSVHEDSQYLAMRADFERGPRVVMLSVREVPQNVARLDEGRVLLRAQRYQEPAVIYGPSFRSFYPSKSRDEAISALLDAEGGASGFPVGWSEGALHGKKVLTPGEVAVSIGHRRVWRDIVERQQQPGPGPWTLVMEDDTRPVVGPRALLEALARFPRPAGDSVVVGLGSCKPNFWMNSAVGYALTPAGAQRLLDWAPGDIPLDWAINKAVEQKHLAGYCSPSPLVTITQKGRSTSKSA